MSEILTKEMMLTLAATFIFYFTLGGLGAFTKDLYDNFVNGKVKIELPRIFIAAISTAFICIGGESYLSERLNLNAIIFVGFLCGVVGFELFGYLSSLKGIKKTFDEIMRIKKCLDLGVPVSPIETDGDKVPSTQETKKESEGETKVHDSTLKTDQATSHEETQKYDSADLLSQVINEEL